jgi:hypothetical protein
MPEVAMADKRAIKPRRTRGGYEAGPKLVSELSPPPKRPGIGAKPAGDSKK